MNTKLIKIIAAAACATTALGISFTSKSEPALAKNAPVVEKSSKALVISSPESPEAYGVGIYRVEGILAKNTKIKVQLDDEEATELTTNSEDGQYDLDIEVKDSGKHVLLLTYKDSKGKEIAQKLEFRASDKKLRVTHSEEVEATNGEPATDNNEPEKTVTEEANHETDVKTEEHTSTLLPTDVESNEDANDDPNSAASRKASGVNDANITAKASAPKKPATTKKKPATSTIKRGIFVLSSHTNFNVVPHGIINIGGKGNPGDKIMLLVDNKPSMRGTVKPNGRWSFPVKIANPGFRKITAQDLRSREAKTVKLKIK